jgi:HEAT repeat protein
MIAATLGQLGDKRAVEPLIAALRDADKAVRYQAALALAKLKDRRAIRPLLHALFDEMPPVGTDSLTGEPLFVRTAAAQALGELRATEAVPALKVLLRDEERSVRLGCPSGAHPHRDDGGVASGGAMP